MEKAKGNWPPYVTAQIITAEEKARIMGNTGIAAKIETTVVNHMEANMNDYANDSLITGISAIKIAKNLGVDFCWITGNKRKISLVDAQELLKLQPAAICFDFDLLEQEQEKEPEPAPELAIESEPVPALLPEFVEASTKAPANPLELPLDERRQRAWGGTLSTPGMQVYIHPRGIVRIEVSGQVKVQKGIQNGVRVFRVERMVPATPDHTTVYRTSNKPPEKIDIPLPTTDVEFDNIEF
jgi:hypothetical protein